MQIPYPVRVLGCVKLSSVHTFLHIAVFLFLFYFCFYVLLVYFHNFLILFYLIFSLLDMKRIYAVISLLVLGTRKLICMYVPAECMLGHICSQLTNL